MSNADNDTKPLVELLQQRMLENRVRAAIHRWYAFYEHEPKNFDHQFELLTDDFQIIRPPESDFKSTRGKEAYRSSLAARPAGQEFTHWLETLELVPESPTSFKAIVTHRHQQRGPARTGAALIRYDLGFSDVGGLLPRLSSLKESIVRMQDEPFQDAYAQNRAASFVHRWCAGIESFDGTQLHELLADEFEMHLSSGDGLRRLEQIVPWVQGQAAQVRLSSHRVRNLTVRPTADGYEVSMEFLWEGISKQEKPMIARTKHDWVLVERSGRYPVLKSFRVRALEPFTPVSVAEALAH